MQLNLQKPAKQAEITHLTKAPADSLLLLLLDNGFHAVVSGQMLLELLI